MTPSSSSRTQLRGARERYTQKNNIWRNRKIEKQQTYLEIHHILYFYPLHCVPGPLFFFHFVLRSVSFFLRREVFGFKRLWQRRFCLILDALGC